jgi:hypothetical protein
MEQPQVKELLTTPEQLIGKTISKTVFPIYSRSCCLHFTDDTAAVIECKVHYENDYEMRIDTSLDDYERYEFELITKEEFEIRSKKKNDELAAEEKKRKRRQYEMLKREFGE